MLRSVLTQKGTAERVPMVAEEPVLPAFRPQPAHMPWLGKGKQPAIDWPVAQMSRVHDYIGPMDAESHAT